MNGEALTTVGEKAGALGVAQWHVLLGEMAASPDLSRIWEQSVRDLGSLDAHDTDQFSSHLSRVFRIVEGMHRQHSQDQLDTEAWHGIEHALRAMCRYPGVQAWWKTRAHGYSAAFSEHIQQFIDDVDLPGRCGEADP